MTILCPPLMLLQKYSLCILSYLCRTNQLLQRIVFNSDYGPCMLYSHLPFSPRGPVELKHVRQGLEIVDLRAYDYVSSPPPPPYGLI